MQSTHDQPSDPRTFVHAPLGRALDRVIVTAAIRFAVTSLAVAVSIGLGLDGDTHTLVHVLPIVALGAYSAVRLSPRVRRLPRLPRDEAWRRAHDADPVAARFAIVLLGFVGMAIVVASIDALLPMIRDPASRGGALGVWMPILVVIDAIAIGALLSEADDLVGRGAAESEHRFRQYWAAPARFREPGSGPG